MRVLVLICLFFLYQNTLSKYVSGKVKITPKEPWKYISKFAYDIGAGKVDAEFSAAIRSPQEDEVNVHLYLDDDFDKMTDTMSCEDRVNLARFTEKVHVTKAEKNVHNFVQSVNQFMRPHVWFVAVSKCDLHDPSLTNRESHKGSIALKYEVVHTNEGSHLSYEDHGLWQTHFLATLVLSFCTFWCLKNIMGKFKQSEPVHPIQYLLLAALACEVLSHVCVIIHLWRYAVNGYGFGFLNFLHSFLSYAGNIQLSCIFILCAWGWTITQDSISSYTPVFVPLLLFVIMAHFTLIILAYLFDNPEKYHDHETFPGTMLVIFRIILFFTMVYGTKQTLGGYRTDQRNALSLDASKKQFLVTFSIFAGIWFLCLPIITLISSFCAPYVRHRLVRTVTMIVQTLAFGLVSRQFLSQSTYHRVSTVAGPSLGW